jgi:hypothetical protein
MNSSYTVTLNGKTAIVRRHTIEMYRSWFRTRARETATVVGIFPCESEMSVKTELNSPSELWLMIGSCSLTLRAALPAREKGDG